jgi:hypothetical protein
MLLVFRKANLTLLCMLAPFSLLPTGFFLDFPQVPRGGLSPKFKCTQLRNQGWGKSDDDAWPQSFLGP